jgi:hypothetical protein
MLLAKPLMRRSRPRAASARGIFFSSEEISAAPCEEVPALWRSGRCATKPGGVTCARLHHAGTPSRWYCCRIAYYWPRLRFRDGDKRRRFAAGGDNRCVGNFVLAGARASPRHGLHTEPRDFKAVATRDDERLSQDGECHCEQCRDEAVSVQGGRCFAALAMTDYGVVLRWSPSAPCLSRSQRFDTQVLFAFSKRKPRGPASTRTVSPSANLPANSSIASGFSICCWIVRLSGRAP